MIVLASFCSPGAGHLYAGVRERGWAFVGAYALAKLLFLPVVAETLAAVLAAARAMVQGISGTGLDPTRLEEIRRLAGAADGSMAALMIAALWCGAMVDALHSAREQADGAWDKAPRNYLLAGIAAWVCPGAAHLYAGRPLQEAATFLGAYLAAQGLGCLLGAAAIVGGLTFIVQAGSLIHGLLMVHTANMAQADAAEADAAQAGSAGTILSPAGVGHADPVPAPPGQTGLPKASPERPAPQRPPPVR
jgi:hypothetical protein